VAVQWNPTIRAVWFQKCYLGSGSGFLEQKNLGSVSVIFKKEEQYKMFEVQLIYVCFDHFC
jgi:hypothetical protein